MRALILRILTLIVGTLDSTGIKGVVYVSSGVHYRDLFRLTFRLTLIVGARGVEENRDLDIFIFSVLMLAEVFGQARFFNSEQVRETRH